MRLGAKLLRYRLVAGLTQVGAAQQVGIHKSSLSRIEIAGREARVPSWNVIDRLGRAYGLTQDQIAELQQLRLVELQTEKAS